MPPRASSPQRAGRFTLVVSPALLREYEHSLSYPRVLRRIGFTPERVRQEVAIFGRLGTVVEPTDVPAVISEDPDDDQVLAAALTGDAQYIVTGDPDLLALGHYQGIRILTPSAFAPLLAAI